MNINMMPRLYSEAVHLWGPNLSPLGIGVGLMITSPYRLTKVEAVVGRTTP